MLSRNKFSPFLQTDYFISFLILAVFLLTNGYQYGWDDQHLEIPFLKSLIDPTLFQGDYYIESLKKNFITYFYPLLSRLISVDQVPAAYFALYLISRYFLFFWIYKLWKLISQKRSTAILCTVMLIVLGRVEEFLYRTFSHQEFALAVVFAGLYFFYKERFVLASFILGIAANIHALYSLFPMVYMGSYLLLNYKKYRLKMLLRSCGIFLTMASPVLIWAVMKQIHTHVPKEALLPEHWIPLYYIACPQNFLFREIPLKHLLDNFPVFLNATKNYWAIFSLCALNFLHNESFKRDKKSQAIIWGAFFMLMVSFIFTYVIPTRFIVDLNLIRNTQFLAFLLMGYTTILVLDVAEKEKPLPVLIMAMMFSLLGLDDVIVILVAIFMISFLYFRQWQRTGDSGKPRLLSALVFFLLLGNMLLAIFGVLFLLFNLKLRFYSPPESIGLLIMFLFAFLYLQLLEKKGRFFLDRKFLVLIPLCIMFVHFVNIHIHYLRLVQNRVGFWAIQNDWEDMQRYVKNNTPKNALLLTPYDMEMGGFRILSERKVLVCYRDCGIIGFDLNAMLEWQKRVADIESFKVFLEPNHDLESAIKSAIYKYKINYVVFMRYYAPPEDLDGITKVYENDTFSLFRINTLPKTNLP